MAAQENHADIVEYLLNNGADQALATDVWSFPLYILLYVFIKVMIDQRSFVNISFAHQTDVWWESRITLLAVECHNLK